MNSIKRFAAGTCFKAAACTTVSIPSRARRNRSRSRTSPKRSATEEIFLLDTFAEAPTASVHRGYKRRLCLHMERFSTCAMKAFPKLPVPPVIRILELLSNGIGKENLKKSKLKRTKPDEEAVSRNAPSESRITVAEINCAQPMSNQTSVRSLIMIDRIN